ncbi:MAG: hypothetical protein EZS28_008393 [Streblomastix strix]|uniref:Uncharacterized protein n=1 Tax=Streblomastix strix TaxID=222440 RepID=A0A5J4WMM0_9EUKA|nr:MAG: hypothetical protein EZS28_008393 [Streblomastix strix]
MLNIYILTAPPNVSECPLLVKLDYKIQTSLSPIEVINDPPRFLDDDKYVDRKDEDVDGVFSNKLYQKSAVESNDGTRMVPQLIIVVLRSFNEKVGSDYVIGNQLLKYCL